MKIEADLHCHTVASTHAYSTVLENLTVAKSKQLSVLAITDHGPGIPDSPHVWHYKNQKCYPREYDGIILLRGIEANIVDFDGTLDADENILKTLDWVIACFHDDAIAGGSIDQHTNAWLNAAQNPYVDLIGHCDRLPFDFDHDTVMKAFKENGKFVEINNHSFDMMKGGREQVKKIALACKKYDLPVIANSDAHICFGVGDVDNAMQLLEEIEYKKELIVNLDAGRIIEHIERKKGIKLRG